MCGQREKARWAEEHAVSGGRMHGASRMVGVVPLRGGAVKSNRELSNEAKSQGGAETQHGKAPARRAGSRTATLTECFSMTGSAQLSGRTRRAGPGHASSLCAKVSPDLVALSP